MKLSIAERVALIEVLPPEGNFATLKIVHNLRQVLSFSEEEFKEWGITIAQNRMTWNETARNAEEKDIPIGEKATDLIVESLKKLDQAEKLTERHFTLYQKFVEGQVEGKAEAA